MKYLKKIICLTGIFLFSVAASAQRHEFGLFGGCSFYMGDLNPEKVFELSKQAYGIAYRINLDARFALKMNFYTGTLTGDDAHTKFRPERNLSFKSSIKEFSCQIELNFLTYAPGSTKYPWTPYIFSGLSLFMFNPQAEYNGIWYKLQPLGTEGQGTTNGPSPYSLTSVSIPFGFGFKFNLGKNLVLCPEWGMRKTYTDYIDDVSTVYYDPNILRGQNTEMSELLADRSAEIGEPQNPIGYQRGNSKSKDWYSFAGVILTFKINNTSGPCPAYKKSILNKWDKLY